MTRTALVTGGRGFIASHLFPVLLDDDWLVRSCGRSDRPASLPEAVDYRVADLAAGEDLDEVVSGVSHVFHLAGASSSFSDEEEMHRSNVVATENLVAAVAGADVERFLYMSTTAVYGEEVELPSPVPEDVEPRPSRGYGKAKWEAEQVVWRQVDKGLPALVVRPVSTYGPGNVKLLGSAILDVAIERYLGLSEILVPTPAVEQRLVHVADVVGASVHLIDHEDAVGRAFNVTAPEYPTSHHIAEILSAELGVGMELDEDPECGPSFAERREGRNRMVAEGMRDDILLTEDRFHFMRKENRNNRVSIDALLGTDFEFAEGDLAGSIARTVGWYLDNRWVL
jgi:UDP-glucose 4-epimerase